MVGAVQVWTSYVLASIIVEVVAKGGICVAVSMISCSEMYVVACVFGR